MGDQVRLFIGVKLSLASLRAVAEAADRMRQAARGEGLAVRWVPPASLHVTLKFLGWTRAAAVEAIEDRVGRALDGETPFDFTARGAGAFPSAQRASVLWIGIEDRDGRLARLAGKLDGALGELGFRAEARAYHPHVTLGRLRDPGDARSVLLPFSEQAYSSTHVESAILFESIMKSSGSEYRMVAEWRLGRQSDRVNRGESKELPALDELQEQGDDGAAT